MTGVATIAPSVAILCFSLALAWRSGVTLLDSRLIWRRYSEGRNYEVWKGWVYSAQLATRRRLAMVEFVVAAGLVGAWLARGWWASVAMLLCCGVALVVVFGEWWLEGGLFASVCLATLGAAVLLWQAVALAGGAPDVIAGMFASFFAAHLYLVAAIRKVRSRHFMDGRIIVDNIAYNAYQAAAGNRDFLPVPSGPMLAVLLSSPAFLALCRTVAILIVAAELALGVGAVGLIPAWITVALAVPAHLAFIVMSPRRIVEFPVAAFGLLLLATTHPILASVFRY